MDEAGFSNELKEMRIVIIGLGLIGGSLALRLNKFNPHLTGIDNNTHTLQFALEHKIVYQISNKIEEGIIDADLIIMAVPVRTIFSIIEQINRIEELPVNENCVIMDVGSTKAEIVEKMQALPRRFQPIGGHPMCGRETSGIESADASLFEDAFFMLTPLPHTDKTTIDRTKNLVKLIGARPYIVDAERHDRIAAAVSHLPYSLASMLVASAMKTGSEDNLLWEAVSSGFRDTSRLAACDVTMMIDILMSNSKAVSNEIISFEKCLNEFRNAIENRDETWLRENLTKIKQKRNQLFCNRST